eukprot:1743608-Rhodomonas_salina.1
MLSPLAPPRVEVSARTLRGVTGGRRKVVKGAGDGGADDGEEALAAAHVPTVSIQVIGTAYCDAAGGRWKPEGKGREGKGAVTGACWSRRPSASPP